MKEYRNFRPPYGRLLERRGSKLRYMFYTKNFIRRLSGSIASNFGTIHSWNVCCTPKLKKNTKTPYFGGLTLWRRRPCTVPRITLRPLPPLFPVSIWNVHVATLNGDDLTRRGIGASLRWSVVTTCRCGAPSSHCSRMRPRRWRHCCRMHVARRRQNKDVHPDSARKRWKRPCVRSRAPHSLPRVKVTVKLRWLLHFFGH